MPTGAKNEASSSAECPLSGVKRTCVDIAGCLFMTQSGHARSIGGGADSAALLRAALATDLARTGRLRFGDAADGVLQMRRPIGQ